MTAGEAIDLVMFLLVPTGVVFLGGYGAYLAIKRIRGGKMKPKTRKEFEDSDRLLRSSRRQAVSEMIAEGLLQLHAKGVLDRDAYKRYALDFGVRYNLPDLLPGKVTMPELKVALKKRRNGGSYFGVYNKVKLPGGARTPSKLEMLLSKM